MKIKESIIQRNDTTKLKDTEYNISQTVKDLSAKSNIDVDPVAAFLVIIVFIVERIFSYFGQRRLNRNTWYLEILLKPNQHLVEEYFEEIKQQTIQSHNNLITVVNTLSLPAYQRQVTLELEEVKKFKRNIEYNFLYLTKSIGSQIHEDLDNDILTLQDKLIKELGRIDILNVDLDNLTSIIETQRANFYRLMYLPIKRGIVRTFLFKLFRPIKKLFSK